MSCVNNKICNCKINVKTLGNDDVKKVNFTGSNFSELNWTEISVRELLCLPDLNPDIGYINEVSVTDEITNTQLIETPYAFTSYRTYYVTTAELSLVQSVVGLISIPSALITSITTAITAIVSLLEVPASLLPPNNPISPILTQLTASVTTINNTVTSINNSIAGIMALTLPLSVCNLINLLQNLYDALNLLQTTLNTVVSLVNSLVSFVATLLPLLSDALNALVAPLLSNITTLVNLLLGYLTSVLNLISSLEANNFLVLLPNAQDTCLTGREIVVEGVLHQSVMYTSTSPDQPVYSVPYDIPFSSYIVLYPSFIGATYSTDVYVVTNLSTCNSITVNGFQYDPSIPLIPDLTETFDVKSYIENIFVNALDEDTIFKDVTLFIKATS